MDFTNKPSDQERLDEEKALAQIENKPVRGAKDPYEPAPVISRAGRNSTVKKVFGWLFLTLLILALATAAAWFWWQSDQAQAALRQSSDSQQALKKENEKLKSQQERDDRAAAAVKSPTDEALITKEVVSHLKAGTSNEKVIANILKQGDKFSYVSAGFEGGGGSAFILKKVEGNWVIIYSGQNGVPAHIVERYSIPEEYRTGQ